MIAIIRIKGRTGIRKDFSETLDRLRLRRKFSCVLVENKKENLGMIKKIRNLVAFGEISDEMLEKMIEIRGKAIDKSKKVSPKEAVTGLKSGKKLEDFNVKPFFRLHPARKGMNTKKQFPKGVLGNHKNKIDELIGRML